MAAPQDNPAPRTTRTDAMVIAVIRGIRAAVMVVGGLFLVALFGGLDAIASYGQPAPNGRAASSATTHVTLDIMPVKPGGPTEDYAAYLPSTVLVLPAHSIITVTIRNFDLDPTPPTQEISPYSHVQGTVDGFAYADGKPYSTLTPGAIAHTFTVDALHLNVPIPSQAASGKHYVTVSFRFHTGQAGTYSWRCFAPCGDGPGEQSGPMAELGYMRGALIVER
ncbi:MAG: hypothetical protein ACM3N4_09160 [Nitrososphaerota archaeon]